MVARLGQGEPTFATSVKLLDDGDTVPRRRWRKRSTRPQHHIHLEYYIWEPDKVGTRFRDLLVGGGASAASQVRVLVDARRLARR